MLCCVSEHNLKVEVLASPGLTLNYNSEITLEMRFDMESSLAVLPYFRLRMWEQTYTQHTQGTVANQLLDSFMWKAELTPGYPRYPNGFHLAYEGGGGLTPQSKGLLTDTRIGLAWPNGDSLATELKINPLTGKFYIGSQRKRPMRMESCFFSQEPPPLIGNFGCTNAIFSLNVQTGFFLKYCQFLRTALHRRCPFSMGLNVNTGCRMKTASYECYCTSCLAGYSFNNYQNNVNVLGIEVNRMLKHGDGRATLKYSQCIHLPSNWFCLEQSQSSNMQDWTRSVSFDFGLRGERASKGYQLSAWRDTTWETRTTETGFQLAVLRDKNGSKTKVAGFLRDVAAGKKTVLGFFCNDPRHWLDLNVDLTVSQPYTIPPSPPKR